MASVIDLHMHSSFSDGSDSAEELLQAVTNSGIRIFSLTDHDTVEGVRKLMHLAPASVQFIPGVEFSCRTQHGKCHILGYNCDIDSDAMRHVLQSGTDLRAKRLSERLQTLEREYGIVFSEEDRAYLFSLNCAGKPHIAALLIRNGYAETVTEAIQTYLRSRKKENDRVSAEEAIQGILDAGGIPVWAHPLGGCNEKRLTEAQFCEQLETLLAYGLRGMECYYSMYSSDEISFLTKTAQSHGLCISGGSDYHGSIKDVPLGCLNANQAEIEPGTLSILDAIK